MQKACDAGETPACTNLGVLYSQGKGVSQNFTKAMSLLKKACDEGIAQGCSNKAILEEALSSASSGGGSYSPADLRNLCYGATEYPSKCYDINNSNLKNLCYGITQGSSYCYDIR